MSDRPEMQDPQLSSLLAALGRELGESGVLTGTAVTERQTADWSGTAAAQPLAILLPRTPAEVAAALRLCSEYRQPLSIQGGLTGLTGGANPHEGELVLSLSRLNRIEEMDPLGGTLVAQAGVTLEALQAFATEQGWFFPVDLGARGSCQIGGNAATNAGGNRVLRYGMMRQSILGLEVALPDGTLLTMLDRVIKNNAGYDLKQYFIGTEGSLGVITRLALKLEPQPSASCTVLCALPDFRAAAELLREARRQLPDLSAFELMWDDYFEACLLALKRQPPFRNAYPLYALVETLGGDEQAGQRAIEDFFEQMMTQGLVCDAVIANSLEQAGQLWDLRDGVSELLAQMKPCIAFDVSVAMPHMDDFVAYLRRGLASDFPDQRHLFFGHLGDGNLHLVCGPFPDEARIEAIEHYVYQAVSDVGGSISAEHGIGMMKKAFLHYSRDPAEIAVMRRLKQTFDPHGILNPGRLIPD
ncbi:FAD-binding oxidoreductase [Mangrovitalea sediminis]|uniref:FAD-binding oxidoreductase n=1 Tax=Mangrovitalea sediminis TaxID=1982043 RepID=UPI0018EA2B2A|nr:FAD-binding oxidoreductase [Mangrovitalea sediminis]